MSYPVAAVRNRSIGGASSYITQWLLRDDFTTDEAAPIASPRTAEPGPGTWTVTDTTNQVSIVDGKLHIVGKSDYADPRVVSASLARVAGRTFVVDWSPLGSTAFELGFSTSTGPAPSRLHQYSYGVIRVGSSSPAVGQYDFSPVIGCVVLRASGAFYVVRDAAGVWLLMWVDGAQTASPVYARGGFHLENQTRDFSRMLVCDVAAPWATDYGIATNRVASPVSGETTTMEASALVEFTWTPAAGETLDLMVRRDSDTDCWSVVCAEATAANANTIKLIERNAGDTERSSAAQTFSAGVAYRIVVVMYGTTIKTWVGVTAKNSYASASHNQTATGVKVSGFTTGSNLVVWPRTLSGAAKAALDEVAA